MIRRNAARGATAAARSSLFASNGGNRRAVLADEWLMPNPIQTSTDPLMCQASDDVSSAENDAQMSLSTAPPPPAAPSPAVSALVSRFTAPSGVHPPFEPSLSKALNDCKIEVASGVVNVATVLFSAPVGLAASIIGGARMFVGVASANRCIERDEAQQILDANQANQSADCRLIGAVPLITGERDIICAKP